MSKWWPISFRNLEWSYAPTGTEEFDLLQTACTGEIFGANDRQRHRQKNLDRARTAVRRTSEFRKYMAAKRQASKSNVMPPPPPPDSPGRKPTRQEVLQRLDVLTQAPAAPVAPPPPLPELGVRHSTGFKIDGVLKYVLQGFQYRYMMLHDYLNTFFHGSDGIDLIVAHMVDYDWWLAKGSETKTKLEDQIKVMERICVLRRGQIHGMAPFDPLKEVAFRAGKSGARSSLALVQNAVKKQGFLGVKMYPPMGFAPLGNKNKEPEFWKPAGLPDWVYQSIEYGSTSKKIGERLDEVLADFYGWCCDDDVPVMAHSSQSVGQTTQFEELAGAAHWADALRQFKSLRISFGHFGDFGNTLGSQDYPEVRAFLDLMSETPNALGEHAFADSAYFNEVLDAHDAVFTRLKELYNRPVSGDRAHFANKFMYGTDWNLLMNAGDIRSYYDSFTAIFTRLDAETPHEGRPLGERFFGWNAAEWLGLRGGKNRDRVEEFYKRNKIDTVNDPPTWLAKLRRG